MIAKCFLQVQSHTIKYKLRKIIEKRERERETSHSISANILTAWECSYTTNQNKDSNHPFKNDMKSNQVDNPFNSDNAHPLTIYTLLS